MIKKKLIVTLGVLALVVGTGLYVNNTQQENAAVVTESKEKSQDDLAKEKVKELNTRVANGEEKIVGQSAIFPDFSKEEAFQEADLVIKGKVDSIDKEYMEHTDIPFTDFKFNVEEYWKSDLSDEENKSIKQLIVTQDGNTQVEFNEHPLMLAGEEYVLFLKRTLDNNNQEKLVMIGGPNGKFNVHNGLIDQEVDTQSVNDESVDEFLEDSSQGEVTEAVTEIVTE
ncbi:hypothetical protein ABEY41_11660 [Peribacillus butanolivorans]|uniref:hypothetical protein n=1 Tax=Peribacillus butanolivorans TaxID=421767 RepID=UPI003D29192C